MTQEYQNSLELLEGIIKENLYSKLVAQLQKDFELANVPLRNLDNLTQTELVQVLKEKIYQLILEQFTAYLNLLYIIDVPEAAFKDLKITDAVEVADQMVFLIVKREFQKLRLKSKYSG